MLFWLCSLMLSQLQSQNYYEQYQSLSKNFPEKPYEIVKKVTDSIIKEAYSESKHLDIANITYDFSRKIAYENDIMDAIYYGELSLKNKEKLQQFDKDYVATLFSVGVYYFYSDYPLEKALYYYNQVIKYNLNPAKTARAYCQIGFCYLFLDNYQKSVNFYNKGISELERLKEFKWLPNAYINLSATYKEIESRESLESMFKMLNKAKNLEQHDVLSTNDYLNLNIGFANYYSYEFNYDFEKSKSYSKKGLELSLKDNNDQYACFNYINFANIYNLQKLDSAKYYSKKAFQYCTDVESLSKAYFQLGDYYNNKKNYISALKNIQEGINLLVADSTKTYTNDINLQELLKSGDKDQLLFMLYEKIKLLHKNNQTKLALQHVLVSDSLINDIQANSSYTNKLHWRTEAAKIYTQGAELSYKLDQPKTAFYLSEKGKALLLTESIIQNTEYTKLPDSIAQKELQLRKKTLITDISEEDIFKTELNYENYIDSISKVFPNHFKKLNFQNTISMEEAQADIDDNTIAISYLWPDKEEDSSYVYALFLNNKESKLLQIEKANTLSKHIDSYKSIISKPFKSQKDKTEYNTVAHQLYKMLFPNLADINIDKKKLVIIPDGSLHNVPFEALLTTPNSENYLLKSNTISYAYSLSFLKYNKARIREASKDLIGFAPQTFNSQLQLNSLSKTVSELDEINKVIDGDYIIEGSATKTSFLNSTKDYKIIHLATHANASDENPWIAFKDDKISLNELYSYKNNAELTVLSACESSIGEIKTGEGVMSLARGFFYSGSNAVLASLWNANDKSTSLIMKDFYEALKIGKSKPEALRVAKLNYLNTHSLSETSPYYWSSFVLIGNESPIEFSSNNTIIYYILTIFILLILSLLYLKRKKI